MLNVLVITVGSYFSKKGPNVDSKIFQDTCCARDLPTSNFVKKQRQKQNIISNQKILSEKPKQKQTISLLHQIHKIILCNENLRPSFYSQMFFFSDLPFFDSLLMPPPQEES